MEPPLHALGVLASQTAMITATLRHVELFTMRGLVTVLWHVPPRETPVAPAAIVACGGAMGGLLGPADGLYQRLGDTWSGRGVPVLRVDYRKPNDMDSCCLDVAGDGHLLTRSADEMFVRLETWLPTVLFDAT